MIPSIHPQVIAKGGASISDNSAITSVCLKPSVRKELWEYENKVYFFKKHPFIGLLCCEIY